MTINEWVQACHGNSKEHGWWDDGVRVADIPEKLMLIVTEVADVMYEDISKIDGKPAGFPSELADIVIRVFDLCGAFKIDLEGAIARKHEYNKTREFRHGNKRA